VAILAARIVVADLLSVSSFFSSQSFAPRMANRTMGEHKAIQKTNHDMVPITILS
jgi:hypothetical protein